MRLPLLPIVTALTVALPAAAQTGSISDAEIKEAIAWGLEHKKSLAVSQTTNGIPPGGNLLTPADVRDYYHIVISGPFARVASAAAANARRYLPFTGDSVTAAMRAPVIHLVVVPASPSWDRSLRRWESSPDVEHVLIQPKAQKGQDRPPPIQPQATSKERATYTYGSGMTADVQGMVAEFAPSALPRDVDWEVVIVTSGKEYRWPISKGKFSALR